MSDENTKATETTNGAASALSAGLGVVDEETARLYAGKCCFCTFFRDAYIRTDEHQWVDNPGWCVRYPPVFVGGTRDDAEDVDYSRFKQPGVVGGDECGEFVQGGTPNVEVTGSPALSASPCGLPGYALEEK